MVLQEIHDALDICIEKWSKKEKRKVTDFDRWKKLLIKFIKCKIKKLRKKKYTLTFNKKQIINNLKNIHTQYVVVGADKAANNVIIICKKYYVIVLEMN